MLVKQPDTLHPGVRWLAEPRLSPACYDSPGDPRKLTRQSTGKLCQIKLLQQQIAEAKKPLA
jgi:hypothetical protein